MSEDAAHGIGLLVDFAQHGVGERIHFLLFLLRKSILSKGFCASKKCKGKIWLAEAEKTSASAHTEDGFESSAMDVVCGCVGGDERDDERGGAGADVHAVLYG